MREAVARRETFRDRREAGRVLAGELGRYAGDPAVVVLGVPRGGVPVAYEVARALAAPLDVFLVRKLGVPGREELAMGAIAQGGVTVVSDEIVTMYGVTPVVLERVKHREAQELARREAAYRAGRAPLDCKGKVALLVDDGLATGATMRAAAVALRTLGPRRVVIAVPVGASETCEALRHVSDEVVCVRHPEPLIAVGFAYDDFTQTTDDEVRELLARAAADRSPR